MMTAMSHSKWPQQTTASPVLGPRACARHDLLPSGDEDLAPHDGGGACGGALARAPREGERERESPMADHGLLTGQSDLIRNRSQSIESTRASDKVMDQGLSMSWGLWTWRGCKFFFS